MKLKFILILLVIALSGCTNNNNNFDQMDAMKKKIEELEQNNAALERTILMDKELHRVFPILSNLALDFVRGRTQGNLELLESVVSDDIIITEEEGSLFGEYMFSEDLIQYPLFIQERQSLYQDMVIQGVGYDERNEVYMLHIREFYNEASGEPGSPPVFLNLYFKATDEGFRITQFEFDA